MGRYPNACIAIANLIAACPSSVSAVSSEQTAAVDIFRDACMNGQVSLPSGTATPVSGKAVPVYIRDFVATQFKSRSIYKLTILPESYLVVFGGGTLFKYQYQNGCSLVSEYITAYDLWSTLTHRTSDLHKYRAAQRYEMSKPSEGWDLSVWWVDSFAIDSHRYSIAQVGIMTDAMRDRAGKDRESFTPYRGPQTPSNGG